MHQSASTYKRSLEELGLDALNRRLILAGVEEGSLIEQEPADPISNLKTVLCDEHDELKIIKEREIGDNNVVAIAENYLAFLQTQTSTIETEVAKDNIQKALYLIYYHGLSTLTRDKHKASQFLGGSELPISRWSTPYFYWTISVINIARLLVSRILQIIKESTKLDALKNPLEKLSLAGAIIYSLRSVFDLGIIFKHFCLATCFTQDSENSAAGAKAALFKDNRHHRLLNNCVWAVLLWCTSYNIIDDNVWFSVGYLFDIACSEFRMESQATAKSTLLPFLANEDLKAEVTENIKTLEKNFLHDGLIYLAAAVGVAMNLEPKTLLASYGFLARISSRYWNHFNVLEMGATLCITFLASFWLLKEWNESESSAPCKITGMALTGIAQSFQLLRKIKENVNNRINIQVDPAPSATPNSEYTSPAIN